MADNTTLNAGTGGDSIRDKDRAGVKTQIVGLDINASGSEVLGTGDATNGLDVDVTRVQGTVTVSGTVTANLAAGTNNVGDIDVLTMPATAADGGAQPATTVVVSGNDGSNVQTLKTDVNGILQTAQNGTVTVSGTVTANAGTGPFPVSDNSGSLTVDAPAATPVFVRLSDGAAAITALPVTDNGGSLTVDGTVGITANSSVNVAQMAGTTTDTNSGTKSAGTQRVVLATDQPQLTNALKVDGSAVTQPVSGTVTANLAAATSGGATPSTYVSAASTNATSVKASAGQLYGVMLSNVNAAARYLKIFNKASAPTVGSDTPVMNLIIPGNTAGAGSNVVLDGGVAFGTGIAFAITTGAALLDSGAVAASEITVTLLTK
jgi:hypothetical protein